MGLMKNIGFVLVLLLSLTSCKNKSAKSVSGNSELSLKEQSITNGKSIYNKVCSKCHLKTGKGVPRVYPPLNNSNWLVSKRDSVIHTVKYGRKGQIKVNGKPYQNMMPNPNLSDQEVTDVLNYVAQAWENKPKKAFNLNEVQSINE